MADVGHCWDQIFGTHRAQQSCWNWSFLRFGSLMRLIPHCNVCHLSLLCWNCFISIQTGFSGCAVENRAAYVSHPAVIVVSPRRGGKSIRGETKINVRERKGRDKDIQSMKRKSSSSVLTLRCNSWRLNVTVVLATWRRKNSPVWGWVRCLNCLWHCNLISAGGSPRLSWLPMLSFPGASTMDLGADKCVIREASRKQSSPPYSNLFLSRTRRLQGPHYIRKSADAVCLTFSSIFSSQFVHCVLSGCMADLFPSLFLQKKKKKKKKNTHKKKKNKTKKNQQKTKLNSIDKIE